MLNKYEINNMIDNYIEGLASSGMVRSFYPNAINKALDLPLTQVLERLNRLIEDEVIELKFEIRCHEGSHIIDVVSDYSKYIDSEISCLYCNDDIYIDLSNISPIYYFKDEYKEYIKKKKKMNKMKSKLYHSQEVAMIT